MVLAGGENAAYRERVGRGGGAWRHRVEVWWSGERVDQFGDDGVPLVDGDVSVNLGNRVTRSLSASIPADLYPFADDDLLSPLGAQLRVFAGWRFGALPVDWFPVFVGPVTSVGRISPRSSEFSLSASDLAEGVIADGFLATRIPKAGTLATAEFRKLILETYPRISFGRIDEPYTVVPESAWTSDRAGACDTMAKAASCMWFFDAAGAPTWRRIPWTLTSFESADLAVTSGTGLLDLSLEISRDGVFNVVVVSGSGMGTEAPVSAIVFDLDASSPTYINGPLGSRVLRVSEDVATMAQAQSLAQQRLLRSRAVSRTVTADLVADPSLELCDIMDLQLLGWSIRAALTSFKIPLTGGTPAMMGCTFREASGAVADG